MNLSLIFMVLLMLMLKNAPKLELKDSPNNNFWSLFKREILNGAR